MNPEIIGKAFPVLQVNLEPGEEVISTHGSFSWMSNNLQISATAGLSGGLGKIAKRVLGGGGLMMTKYSAPDREPAMVAFAAKVPGHIVETEITPNHSVLVYRHGWLCATREVSPSVGFQHSVMGGLFGGNGFVLEKLEGQGRAWVELAGEVQRYDLAPGEQLLVHPGHIGMFESTVSYRIGMMPGLGNRFFGGNGFFNVTLTGPGAIWLQSMPTIILAEALAPYLLAQQNGRQS